MRKLFVLLASSAALLTSIAPISAAAGVNVNWVEPSEYTDVRPANESRKRFAERTLAKLEEHFVKLGEKLPSDQELEISVKDLDLAGQVWPGSFVGLPSASEVRLIKRIDIPRIHLSYKLKDHQGNVLKEEQDIKLKDMSFQERGTAINRNDALRYEKRMIEDWFEQTFL